MALNGALVAWNEAYAQLNEPLFFVLRAQINNDELFVKIYFEGFDSDQRNCEGTCHITAPEVFE